MKLEHFDSLVDIRKWYRENNEPKEMEISYKNYLKLQELLTNFQRIQVDQEGKFDGIIIKINTKK